MVEETQERICQAIEPHADDPRAALQALVSAVLRVHQQYRPLLATMRDRRLMKLLEPAHRETLRAQVLEPARRVIERGIQAGAFQEDLDPDLAAATIIGALTGVIDLLGERYPLAELEKRLFQPFWTMFAK